MATLNFGVNAGNSTQFVSMFGMATNVLYTMSNGWWVSESVLTTMGITEADFDGDFWEMDDLFARGAQGIPAVSDIGLYGIAQSGWLCFFSAQQRRKHNQQCQNQYHTRSGCGVKRNPLLRDPEYGLLRFILFHKNCSFLLVIIANRSLLYKTQMIGGGSVN